MRLQTYLTWRCNVSWVSDINPSRLSGAFIRQHTVRIMACRPAQRKTLIEPAWLIVNETLRNKLQSILNQYRSLHSRNSILKCRLRNTGFFIRTQCVNTIKLSVGHHHIPIKKILLPHKKIHITSTLADFNTHSSHGKGGNTYILQEMFVCYPYLYRLHKYFAKRKIRCNIHQENRVGLWAPDLLYPVRSYAVCIRVWVAEPVKIYTQVRRVKCIHISHDRIEYCPPNYCRSILKPFVLKSDSLKWHASDPKSQYYAHGKHGFCKRKRNKLPWW